MLKSRSILSRMSPLFAFLVIATTGAVLLASLVQIGGLAAFVQNEAQGETTDVSSSDNGKIEKEFAQWMLPSGDLHLSSSQHCSGRVFDELVETRSALSATHLQRGPPSARPAG